MGNAVASHLDAITSKTLTNHIRIRKWFGSDGWDYEYIDAVASGTIQRTTGTVYVNGSLACAKNNNTRETDSYNTGSWDYYSGAHTDATSGYISGGSSTVFINGVPLARQGDSVIIHSGATTTIQGGSPNVFAG